LIYFLLSILHLLYYFFWTIDVIDEFIPSSIFQAKYRIPTYSLEGTAETLQLFSVNNGNGEIRTKNALTVNTQDRYLVCLFDLSSPGWSPSELMWWCSIRCP